MAARLPTEEISAFTGSTGVGQPMVSPQLLDFVSKELERISGIQKNARKLREEQALSRKKQPPKGGKGGGGEE